jgi:hypothetical protein
MTQRQIARSLGLRDGANASYLLLTYRGRCRYRNRYLVWRAADSRVTAPRHVIDSDTDSDADPGKRSESKRANALDAFALGLRDGAGLCRMLAQAGARVRRNRGVRKR